MKPPRVGRGDSLTHARPPGDRDTRRGPPNTYAARGHPATGGALPRPAGSLGNANVARGAGSPAATGRTPAGWGTRGSPLIRGAGARDADAPSWPARAPGGRRARAATDRYREGLRRQRAEPGAVSEERSDRERRERMERGFGGGRGRKRETLPGAPRDHSGLDSSREDTTSWLPERPPLAGSALPPPPAVRAARLRLSLRRFAANPARLCPPPRPPASRLHDNSAPTPRPAPPPRRRDSKGSRLTSSGGGVNGGQRPIRGEGREGKRREDRKGLECICWRGGA